MNVSNVMSKEPRAVRAVDRLDAAASILWEQDCGFVPVVDSANVLVGVLTDRDLCMASYTQGMALRDLPVMAVMAREILACKPDDTIASAMAAMAELQVHRLPVVDARGVLVGVLSSNDLVQAAKARPAAIDGAKVLDTLAAISEPRRGARDFLAPAKAAGKAEMAAATASASPVSKASAKKTPAKKAPAKKAAAKKAPAKKAAAKKASAGKKRAAKASPRKRLT